MKDIYEQRENFYLQPSTVTKGGVGLFLLLGLGTLVYGLSVGDQTRTWGALLFNLLLFYSIALGGVAFGSMQDVVGAEWGRPIKRLHESFGAFLTPATILFIVFLLCIKFRVAGAGSLYRWIEDPSILDHFWGKKTWLQENFMIARDIFALVVMWVVAKWHLKQTIARDLLYVAGKKAEAKKTGELAQAKLRFWSGPVLVVYAFGFSLLAFDLTMSLSPLWFSTLWGGWSFAIMMQTLFALTLICMFWLKDSTFGKYFSRNQFHDLGKLLHGFSIFYAYLTFAHILTYWYGNVPEETEYFLHRMHSPWLAIVIASPIMSFVIPLFAFIPKASKWTAPITLPLCFMILVAQWLGYLIVVQPEVVSADAWGGPLLEIGVFFGVAGIFAASFFRFAAKTPMLSVADPLLEASLQEGHH